MKYLVTGIGSRSTPSCILKEMESIGKWCLENNVTIRSGHADGADWAFEKGAQERCITYLPSDNFNNQLVSRANMITINEDKFPEYDVITRKFHPNYSALSYFAKKLMHRNSCQVLGLNLDIPTSCIICWTSDGKASGGTGHAIRIARNYEIPVYNMQHQKYNTCRKMIIQMNSLWGQEHIQPKKLF